MAPAGTEPDRLDVEEFKLHEEATVSVPQWCANRRGTAQASSINQLNETIVPIIERTTLNSLGEYLNLDPKRKDPVSRAKRRQAKRKLRAAFGVPSPNGSNGNELPGWTSSAG